MMKNILIKQYRQLISIVFIIATVSGCGTSPKVHFYALESNDSLQLIGIERGLVIGLNSVNIAPYLDRPQIVTRTHQHKLELSEFNRWVEPLKSSVSRVIAINLSYQLGTNRIYFLPRRNKAMPLDYKVTIDIARFDGQLGEKAKLTSRWSILDKNDHPLFTKVSVISEPTTGVLYENLVEAQNRTLKQLTLEIVKVIKERKQK